jgi:23S rRNA (uracil1939-C5)-methyltransferase
MQPGSIITVDIEKPIAGGRMLARYNGRIIFVAGAIPGERVRARVTRVAKGAVYADTVEPLVLSPDRRALVSDGRCGGNVLEHVTPERQGRLKGEIIADAFTRVGRMSLPAVPLVISSPEAGYRMRARLHVRGARIGFMREGSHDLCDVGPTRQLLPAAVTWIDRAIELLGERQMSKLLSIEIAENVPASERVAHLELVAGTSADALSTLAGELTGLSVQAVDALEPRQLAGDRVLHDVLCIRQRGDERTCELDHDVRAFFQGNRYLLERLASHVTELATEGTIVDLYAGVGLFGLSLAAHGRKDVTLVEGDRVSGESLTSNAARFSAGIQVQRVSVEHYLRSARATTRPETVILDPPRTGLSAEALAALIRRQPSELIYVSCDVATLARDARGLVDAGYELTGVTGFDLFPNTAHVESVSRFVHVNP